MTYGFRVYRLELEPLLGSQVSWQIDGAPLIDLIHEALQPLAETQLQLPAHPDVRLEVQRETFEADPCDPGNETLTFTRCDRRGPNHLQIRAEYGRVGALNSARSTKPGVGDQTIPLRAHTASEEWRLELIAPSAADGVGALVTEVITNRGVQRPVAAWIAVAVRKAYQKHFKFATKQLQDAAYLRGLMAAADRVSVEVTAHKRSGSGTPDGRPFVIGQAVTSEATKESILDHIKNELGWLDHTPEGRSLLEIVNLDDLAVDEVGGAVILDGKAGYKRINIDNLKAGFTYILAKDFQPSSSDWDSRVRDKVKELMPDLRWAKTEGTTGGDG